MTRRKITALTLSVTLSRVMMSCGGTSIASWRSEMRTIRSTGANTRMMPGPFSCPSKRPRRKITPRSYSARILIELRRYKITTIVTMAENERPICASAPDCQERFFGGLYRKSLAATAFPESLGVSCMMPISDHGRGWSALYRWSGIYSQLQSIDRADDHSLSSGYADRRCCVPKLAMNEYFSPR